MKLTFRILAISVFLLSAQFSFGQISSSNEQDKNPYIVWVKPLDKTPSFKGYLSEVGDTLIIAPLKMSKPTKKISLVNVNYLEFYKKGEAVKSTLLGGLAGFGIGAIIGYISYTPSCPSSSGTFCFEFGPRVSALGAGILGTIPGLLIGAAIGQKRIKVPIRESNKSIQAQKEELRKYKFGG